MSEPQEQTKAMTVTRERLITEAPAAMFDSAAFEHLQRVATVVYRSGFVPKSLTHDGPGDNAIELPEAMVVARCILLADQANRAGADVVGYIQATSVINGRLMHEGKLVNAIVQRRLGIRLKYRFGLWDTDHIVFPDLVLDKEDPRFNQPIDPTFFHGAAERLAVRAFNPDSPDEFVEGSVGQWKTTRSGSPWSKAADWPRQLRYRAVREWARAYDPGTVLGMIADGDQEVEMITDVTPRKSGVMQRLSGEQTGAGFDAEHVERETAPKAARASRKPRAPADEPEEPTHETSEAEPTKAPEVQIAEAKEAAELVGVVPTTAEAPTDPATAPTAESEPATPASAEPAAEALPDQAASSPATASPPTNAGLDATDEAEEVDNDDLPAELQTLITATETVGSWDEVKAAMGAFQKGTLWPTLSPEQQNHIRASTWETLADRNLEWLPDHHHDLSAFRLWVEAQDAIDEIRAALALLQADPGFQAKGETMRLTIAAAASDRIKALEE